MDGPSKTHRCGKRHTSAVNGGCKRVIAHTNLLTPLWVPRENATLYGHVQRLHGVGAPSQGIFTAQTYCVSSSQRQGLPAPVLLHRHHLPAGGPYMIRMKTSQKQARKTCQVNMVYTQCIRRVLCSSFLQRTACTTPFVVSFQ